MTAPRLIPLAEAERRASGPRNPTSRLEVIRAPDLDGLPMPQRRWLVRDWIPDKAVTLLGGDGGTGKSLLALQLMASAALGRPWLGIDMPRRRSLALFCEDDEAEVHLRLEAIARHLGVSFSELDGVSWSARSGKPNVLMQFTGDGNGKPTTLWQEVMAQAKDEAAQLVIIDTLADAFAGNENYRGQARAFINMLRDLANAIDGAVILTAHPSVAGQSSGTGLSGSTAWNNSVRSRLYLTRPSGDDADPDGRVLKRMKSNYSGAGDQIRLEWRNGVLQPTDPPPGSVGGPRSVVERIEVDRLLVDALRKLVNAGAMVSAEPAAKTGFANVIRTLPECRHLSHGAVVAAQTRLVDAGKLVKVPMGPPSKHRIYLRTVDTVYSGETKREAE